MSYWADDTHRAIIRGRRERNLAAGRCINDNNAGTHGKATHGVRCMRCYLTHRYGSVVARQMECWERFEAVQL